MVSKLSSLVLNYNSSVQFLLLGLEDLIFEVVSNFQIKLL